MTLYELRRDAGATAGHVSGNVGGSGRMTTEHDQSRFASDAPLTRRAPMRWRQSVRSQRVFISSTSKDLFAHRKRVHDDLERMYQVPVDMAQFGAGAADATTASYTELATADIVVLIVAWRYGFVPKGETRSVTELEYEEAKRLGLPIYVYLADPTTEADDGLGAVFPTETRQPEYAGQLAAFRVRLSDSNANTYDTFDSPADLSSRVLAALGRRLLRVEQVGRHALVEARALDRRTFKLGDDDAATFAYQTGPVREAWDAATQALGNAAAGVGGKRGIVALGEANAGKTRLALETLMETLPEWPVLRWSEAFTSADLPLAGSLPGDGLVVFIDDLQNYAPLTQQGPDGRMVALASNPAATLRALVESITTPLVIVATCRSEDEVRARAELGWLFTKLVSVLLPQFSAKVEDAEAQRVIATFTEQGATHTEDWDGTLGSLVLGLSTKRAQYENLVARGSPAVEVLRAMKLLTEAQITEHTERRLRAVCAEVFHYGAIGHEERVWREAYKELLRLQFVRVTSGTEGDQPFMLVIRKDAYFDEEKVLTDYPDASEPGELMRHLVALQRTLVALEDVAGLFSLGNVFARRAEYSKAMLAYDRALALNSDDAATWFAKGVALSKLGRYKEALSAYDRALALDSDDAATWFAKGSAVYYLGRYEEALSAYDRALALDLDDAATWYAKGVALRRLGRYEEALFAYDHAQTLDPDDAATWFAKGVALSKLGRYEEALFAYDRALALRPDHADTWNNKGLMLMQSGRYEEALTAFERVLAQQPEHAVSWNNKGYALRGLNRYEEALAAIDEALRLKPEDANYWESHGEILLGVERYEEALADFDRALDLSPDSVGIWYNKGVGLAALGRNEEALAAHDQALSLAPENAYSWNGRGYALMRLGRYEEALAAIDEALRLEPESADWWDSRGEILLEAGRAEEAVVAYEEALARAPGMASAREGRARALRALGRDAEALDGSASPPQES